MSNGKKNKKLYNYVVNTLGVSREMIKEVVEQRVDAILKTIMNEKMNNSEIEKMILDRVAYIIKHGSPSHSFERDSFDNHVAHSVRDAVEKRVMKEFKIQVTAKLKRPVSHKPKGKKKS